MHLRRRHQALAQHGARARIGQAQAQVGIGRQQTLAGGARLDHAQMGRPVDVIAQAAQGAHADVRVRQCNARGVPELGEQHDMRGLRLVQRRYQRVGQGDVLAVEQWLGVAVQR
jgi:hypothetical protein